MNVEDIRLMNEKIFILESIHLSVLYGPGSPFLPLLKEAFPQLKIIARGEQLKVQELRKK